MDEIEFGEILLHNLPGAKISQFIPATWRRNTPSAVGERQILPMQQNKTDEDLVKACMLSGFALARR